MGTIRTDQKATFAIAAFNASNLPVSFTPDAPPEWSCDAPFGPTAVSPDGLSLTVDPQPTYHAGQSFSTSVTVKIGGVSYDATYTLTLVDAAAPPPPAGVVASIGLTVTFSPR